jgi:GntR family transcriptional regulator/MocR family aminotransferase
MDGPRAKSGQEQQAKSDAGHGFSLRADSLRRDAKEPVYQQLYLSIKDAILAGTFPDGARLPSSRSLATQLGISRTTVDLAYNLLAGDGLVHGRTAKGTLVTSGVPARPVVQPSASGLDAAAGSARPGPLAPGMAAIDLFPRKVWSRLATRHAKNLQPDDMLARDPAGHQRLREAIANRVRLLRGMACEAGQVFISQDRGSAMLLVLAASSARGKAAIVDGQALSRPVRGALMTMGLAMQAPDFDALDRDGWPAAAVAILNAEDLAAARRTLTRESAQRLAGWARRHSAWLVDDDRDLDLFEHGAQPALLGHGPCADLAIYLGSFERSVFPAAGCAFVVVPQAMVARFAEAAASVPGQAPLQVQRVMSDFITQGYIGRHANRLRRAHAERRKSALAALRGGRATRRLSFNAAGSSLVAALAAGVDARALRDALEASRLGARLLRAEGPGPALLQVGYGGAPPRELTAAIERLDALLDAA